MSATTATRSQAERVQRSDRALLHAAVSLIAERGYGGATLAAIGERAGYSRGLVTQRFGSKDGLLWALVEEMIRSWGSRALRPAVDDAVGTDAMRRAVEVYADAVDRAPAEVRALYALLFEALGPLPGLRPRFAELHRHMRADVERWVRAGQAAGTVRTGIDPARQAALFVGTVRGLTLQWLLEPETVDLRGLLEEYASTLEPALSAPRGRRSR